MQFGKISAIGNGNRDQLNSSLSTDREKKKGKE